MGVSGRWGEAEGGGRCRKEEVGGGRWETPEGGGSPAVGVTRQDHTNWAELHCVGLPACLLAWRVCVAEQHKQD